MITHDGSRIPVFRERWDPADKEWIWIAWDDVLDGASIQSSAWTLPDGWESHDTQESQSVEDDRGNAYEAANGVLTSNPDAEEGRYTIANKIVLSDGREYERSVYVIVANI